MKHIKCLFENDPKLKNSKTSASVVEFTVSNMDVEAMKLDKIKHEFFPHFSTA